jgi:hypothetical protein
MKYNYFLLIVFSISLIVQIQSCTSDKSQSLIKENYSPGTANVFALIDLTENSGSNVLVNMTVTKILGYGAGSSPIPDNTKLTALAKIDGVKTFLSKTNKGELYSVELKLLQGGVNTTASLKWEIISISKNN